MPTKEVVGKFVDSIAANVPHIQRRTPEGVSGRLLEEVVELCLATGMYPKDIMCHVMDSIHNQASKLGRRQGRVVYPSFYREEPFADSIAEEIADCGILLKDLAYVAGVDQDLVEDEKWDKFIRREFYVSDTGTLYATKKPEG